MTEFTAPDSQLKRSRLDAQRRALHMASLSQDDYRRILRLLQLLCDANCAWISLLGEQEDTLLEGLDIPAGAPPSLAERIIASEGLFECASADCDGQLRSHPWCSEHELGWLAAYPLFSPEGHAIGYVAVAANQPRSMDIRHRLAFVDLVSMLETEMQLRFLLSTQAPALRALMQRPLRETGHLMEPDGMADLLHYSYTRCRLEGRPYALALVELDPLTQAELDIEQRDELQQAAASRLLRTLRAGDLIGAWQDHGLLVLLPGVDAEELYSIGDKLVQSLYDKVEIGSRQIDLSASLGLVGLAVLTPRQSTDMLLTAARHALEQAIEAGRNRARIQRLP